MQVDSLPAEPPGKPKSTGVGSCSLLQRIFSTKKSNPDPPHCRGILYQLSYQGSSDQGSNSHPLLWKCKVLTIGPPGKTWKEPSLPDKFHFRTALVECAFSKEMLLFFSTSHATEEQTPVEQSPSVWRGTRDLCNLRRRIRISEAHRREVQPLSATPTLPL